MNCLRQFLNAILLWIIIIVPCTNAKQDELFPLTIIHINDFHSRYEPITTKGDACDETRQRCIGGLARIVHTIRRLKREERHRNVLYLNAGDNYQGTLFYNIGLWNVTAQLMNLEPPDYMTLGNHEFDNSVPGIVPFLQNIRTQVLVANMNSTEEPEMSGKYAWSALTTFPEWKRKVGFIGLIMSNADVVANTRQLKFLKESDVVIKNSQQLRESGADIIIVISHIGYDVDQRLANETADYIDIIVGGHSHSYLYTGDDYPAFETPEGPYPTVIEKGERKVLIVQAGCHGKHLGHLTVFFDKNNKIHHYEGNPIYMGTDIRQDKAVKKAIEPWKKIVDKEGSRIVGCATRPLSKDYCRSGECELGNFYADAVANTAGGNRKLCETQKIWTNASIALLNAGTIKTSMPEGAWTYAQLVAFSPYDNFEIEFDIKGIYIKEALEHATTLLGVKSTTKKKRTRLLHLSGIKVVYDMSKPINSRVQSVKVLKKRCPYGQYVQLKNEKIYRIVTPDFLVNGGDGFSMFRHATNKKVHKIATDALEDYLKVTNPINPQIEKRITIINADNMEL